LVQQFALISWQKEQVLSNMNYLLAVFSVFLFSFTVPFTRMAALEAAPELVTALRLLGGGVVCLVLVLRDDWRPPRRIWRQLLFTSLGAVLGFAAFMAFALRQVPGSHGAVALAALPALTAAYASLRDRRNPGIKFWCFALAGTLLSLLFFVNKADQLLMGDLLLGLALVAAMFGYVEGARLSREFGGRRVMSWAIVLTMPVILLTVLLYLPHPEFRIYWSQMMNLSHTAWFSILYLALVSQSAGMFLWYAVLARGPMEKIALTQLIQPFFTLFAAVFLLGESVDNSAWLIALLVAVCVVGANRAKDFAAPVAHSRRSGHEPKDALNQTTRA
jgi:drug/metabolite transporter (DMT)-like permease